MQIEYHKVFPNARQHITALPPSKERYIDVNKQLQKLSQNTSSNFISTKNFLDQHTGRLRANLLKLDGFHYNEIGVKIIAKEMKKSLYSTANLGSKNLTILCNVTPSNVAPPISVPSNTVHANVVPPNVIPPNVVPSNVIPSNVVPSNSVQTDAIQTDSVHKNATPTDSVHTNVVPTNAALQTNHHTPGEYDFLL